MKDCLKIYHFSLFDSGYSSVHSLIRELFDAPKTICPSLFEGDLLYVLSKKSPVKLLHHSSQNVEPVIDKTIKAVNLKTHVAFCNRHRENMNPKKILPEEALEKFCSLSGLETNKANCSFLGPHFEKKFHIHNSFQIKGDFIIKDHKKFKQALTNGVGSRKSYGYGLLLIKQSEQGGKNESKN